MAMYLGGAIALAVDPSSRSEYLIGQDELFHGHDDEPAGGNAMARHPYYGLFFCDILCVLVTKPFAYRQDHESCTHDVIVVSSASLVY